MHETYLQVVSRFKYEGDDPHRLCLDEMYRQRRVMWAPDMRMPLTKFLDYFRKFYNHHKARFTPDGRNLGTFTADRLIQAVRLFFKDYVQLVKEGDREEFAGIFLPASLSDAPRGRPPTRPTARSGSIVPGEDAPEDDIEESGNGDDDDDDDKSDSIGEPIYTPGFPGIQNRASDPLDV